MKIAAINDLSGLGKCSLLADISVLSSMGFEVCPVPTAVLTAQTEFPSYYIHDTGDIIFHSMEEWEKMGVQFDGILTGFLPHQRQADDVINFVKCFKKEKTILLVDPVMGDDGVCYSNYSEDMLNKIKLLTSKADIITPNLTELCLLAGENAPEFIGGIKSGSDLESVVCLAEKIRRDTKQSIVITGIPIKKDDLYNIVINSECVEIIPCKTNGKSYSGTGDLFAATLMGNILTGASVIDAVRSTVDFISKAIAITLLKDRNYGVDFEKILASKQ